MDKKCPWGQVNITDQDIAMSFISNISWLSMMHIDPVWVYKGVFKV